MEDLHTAIAARPAGIVLYNDQVQRGRRKAAEEVGMVQWVKQRDDDRAARALALRPGRITAYRALLARQRQGALAPRDAVALEGLREFLRSSGGIPADEGSPATPPAEEIEDRG